MRFSKARKALAGAAIVFGALTVFNGGRALFGSVEAQAAVGNAVPFVLWFNFIAGFGYVIAGWGLWFERHWALWAAFALALATALVAVACGIYVLGGAAYELRTFAALGLRLAFWSVVSAVVWKNVRFR